MEHARSAENDLPVSGAGVKLWAADKPNDTFTGAIHSMKKIHRTRDLAMQAQ